MTMLLVAWRNIWRNKRRTAITLAAIALNTAVLIGTFAFIEGTMNQLTGNITELALGHAQVHAPSYLDDRSIYKTLEQPEAILAAAEAAGFDASARSYGYGLVASGKKSAGASFWGVDPASEKAAFALPRRLLKGAYLSAESKGGVVLGRKLARSLHADLGSEIIALVQAADGSIGNEMFHVVGILKTAGDDVDRGAVMLHRSDFARLFETERVHEIAINSGNRTPLASIAGAMGPIAGNGELKTWRELLPAMARMMDMSEGSIWIFAMVFYLAAAMGVLNTMLMATHDRVREFGVIKALGATPWRIIRDVVAEGWMLSLVATVIGLGIGVALAMYLQVYGINFGSDLDLSIGGVAYDPVIYGALKVDHVINSVVTMWIMCVLASLYPAIKAARLNTVEAMTHV